MAIKKLQNNFTTPEQSKRLLELGVPADSADCYLLRTHTKGDTFIVEVLHDELYSKKDKFTNMLEYIPCWSAGRLIDIFEKCTGERFSREINASTLQLIPLIEDVIAQIEKHLKIMIYRRLDLSKLGE